MVEKGDMVEVTLKGKVIEVFDEDDYHGPDNEDGYSVNLENQGELQLGGKDVFVTEDKLEVLDE